MHVETRSSVTATKDGFKAQIETGPEGTSIRIINTSPKSHDATGRHSNAIDLTPETLIALRDVLYDFEASMFDKPKPFQGPKGSETSFEVRFPKGRKPFQSRAEADQFAKDQRFLTDGWAEVSQVIRIVVDKR